MDNRIVLNTGPIIAFGKMGCIDVIRELPFEFYAPEQVRAEIINGNQLGYPIAFPVWIGVISLSASLSKLTLSNLDAGEAAVIESAVQNGISRVCIDDQKGRRAALATGLSILGSLGMIGRAKELGLISDAGRMIRKAQSLGYHYDQKLVSSVLKGLGENE